VGYRLPGFAPNIHGIRNGGDLRSEEFVKFALNPPGATARADSCPPEKAPCAFRPALTGGVLFVVHSFWSRLFVELAGDQIWCALLTRARESRAPGFRVARCAPPSFLPAGRGSLAGFAFARIRMAVGEVRSADEYMAASPLSHPPRDNEAPRFASQFDLGGAARRQTGDLSGGSQLDGPKANGKPQEVRGRFRESLGSFMSRPRNGRQRASVRAARRQLSKLVVLALLSTG
jgi:hypothetical protein